MAVVAPPATYAVSRGPLALAAGRHITAAPRQAVEAPRNLTSSTRKRGSSPGHRCARGTSPQIGRAAHHISGAVHSATAPVGSATKRAAVSAGRPRVTAGQLGHPRVARPATPSAPAAARSPHDSVGAQVVPESGVQPVAHAPATAATASTVVSGEPMRLSRHGRARRSAGSSATSRWRPG